MNNFARLFHFFKKLKKMNISTLSHFFKKLKKSNFNKNHTRLQMQDAQSTIQQINNDLSFVFLQDKTGGRKMYQDYCWACYVIFNYFDILEKYHLELRKNEELKPYYLIAREKLREFLEKFQKEEICTCDTGELPVAFENPVTEEVIQYDIWADPLLLHYDYLQLDPYGLANLQQHVIEDYREIEERRMEEQRETDMLQELLQELHGQDENHSANRRIMFDYITDEELEENQHIVEEMGWNVFDPQEIPEQHPTLVRLLQQGRQELPIIAQGTSIYSSEYRLNHRLAQKNFLIKTYKVVNDEDGFGDNVTKIRVYRNISALCNEIKFWLDYFDRPHETTIISTIFSLQNKLYSDCIYNIIQFLN